MSEPQKRVHTLLTDAAVAGLSEAEAAELEALLDGQPSDPSYEHAAAAIDLGLLDHTEAMPLELEVAVVEQAGRYWGFTELRPREPTLGGPRGEILLGPDIEATPIQRHWERSDELVLESSLTNGRIDTLGRAQPGDSMRGEILPTAEASDEQDDEHEAERSARFDSEVDAQLDALERPRRSSRGRDGDDDDDDDDDFGDFDDDDDDEPTEPVVAPGRRRKRDRSEPEASRALPISRDYRFARWATYVSAIAALLILAIALWLYVHRNDPPDPEDLDAQIESAADKLEWDFVPEPDEPVAQAASGTIRWSSELQSGVMVLRGLEPNDQVTAQYQLWIQDRERDGPPVDGGVFDIPRDEEEVLIPVDAKLVIGEPEAFLITLERPGGVVVSSQERVALIAKPE